VAALEGWFASYSNRRRLPTAGLPRIPRMIEAVYASLGAQGARVELQPVRATGA
jgi:hypothetical protein